MGCGSQNSTPHPILKVSFLFGDVASDRYRAGASGRVAVNMKIAYAFFKFYNKVAEEIEKDYPEKRLGCLAYAVLSSLPKGAIKLHPKIVPYLTRDSAQLFDKNEQREFRETVDRWNALSSRMGIYEYLYGGGFIIPRIYNRYLLKNVRDQYGVNVDGFYGEAYPNWGLDGPKYWLLSKLLWNHRLDPETLMDDYCKNMYGPAAAAMRQYFDFLEEIWCTQTLVSNRSNYRWLDDIKQIEIFPPARCDQAWKLLEEARNLAKTEIQKKRQCLLNLLLQTLQTLLYQRCRSNAGPH